MQTTTYNHMEERAKYPNLYRIACELAKVNKPDEALKFIGHLDNLTKLDFK